jgi:hypothetical protein
MTAAAPASASSAAAAVVDAHYQAYGAGDQAALLATLADGFRCDPLTGGASWVEGRAAAARFYQQAVARWPLALTDELGAMQVGARVIRRESSRPADPAHGVAEVLAVYTVEGGAITRLDAHRTGPLDGALADETARAIAVAEAQLVAYNAQDLDAHVASFAPDVTVANLHEAPNLTGQGAYRERMAGVFAQFPHNRVELLGRLALGPIVCDHERVLRGPGVEPFEVIAIYTVQDGLIREVRFVR